jgi:voltage-gated potassium channel
MFDDVRTMIRRNRDFITLLWVIAIILAVPYLETTLVGALILVTIITAFLISALYGVSDSPSRVAVGFLLAIPSLLCAWTYMFHPTQEVFIALLLSLAVFLVFILTTVLKKVITAREVTLIELFRAIMVYLMIGLVYGLLYLMLETHIPHSFQFNTGAADTESLIYFSFVALSTSGFGDIVAVSPVARSLVTLELLTGVFYLAVLIGFLVSAHYSTRVSHPREAWREEGTGLIRRYRVPLLSTAGPVAILAIAVVLNMASSVVTMAAGIPLFLDTWGTSFAVITAGFPVGALAGILYNLIMAGTIWETSSLVFAGSSLLVAALTWWFWKNGWVDLRRPERLIATGILTGVANTLLTVVLELVFDIPLYSGTLAVYERILGVLGNPQAALVVMELLVEVTDKTFCIILAAVAATFFTVLFRRELDREDPAPGRSPDEKNRSP